MANLMLCFLPQFNNVPKWEGETGLVNKDEKREFPVGPVVETSHFHFRGRGFNPCQDFSQGTKILHAKKLNSSPEN